MIKAVILLKRKDGMSLQGFADWLLKDHVPLALKLEGLKRYQVNIAREADGDYDGVSELRSEEHTSELQSLMRISYAVFCLKKKTKKDKYTTVTIQKVRKQAASDTHYTYHRNTQ